MKKRILMVDDEELLTKTFTRLLEKNAYEVYSIKNGHDAATMVEEESFDLIICDIRMPGLNGVETIRRINEILEKKDQRPLPVVFITGYADQKLELEAKKLHPIAYLHKPFDSSELLSVINGVIGR